MKQALRVARPGGHRRLRGLPLVLLGIVALGVRPAAAQRTTFVPSIFVEEARTSNVGYLSEGADKLDPDWMTRLGVSLALRREGKGGQAGIRYGGYYERYEKYTVLNHTEHSLGVNFTSPAGQRSTMDFTTAYSYGQIQGNPASIEAADRFLSQRVNRQVLRGTARYDLRGSGRWSFGATATGAQYWFREISGLPQQPSDGTTGVVPSTTIEDRKEVGATAGLRRAMSPRSAIGLVYGYTRYDLEFSGMEQVQNLATTFDLGFAKGATISFQIGAFERRRTSEPAGPATVERGIGLQARGGVSITMAGRRTTTSFVADRSASNGGTLYGTSTDTTAGVTVSNIRPIRWYWTASGRYVLRQPTQGNMQNIQTLAGGASLERRFLNGLALRFTGSYVRQVSGDERFAGSAPAGAVGLVWSPRGADVSGQSYGRVG